MNLFEILADNQRVLIYSDKNTFVLYTWNKSLTLQAYRQPRRAFLADKDMWDEIDVQTLSNMPESFEAARSAAINWSAASDSHHSTALSWSA